MKKIFIKEVAGLNKNAFIYVSVFEYNNTLNNYEYKVPTNNGEKDFGFLWNWKKYDGSDCFPFDFDSNEIPLDSYSKGKLLLYSF